jgi:hypothetical protein
MMILVTNVVAMMTRTAVDDKECGVGRCLRATGDRLPLPRGVLQGPIVLDGDGFWNRRPLRHRLPNRINIRPIEVSGAVPTPAPYYKLS